MRAVGGLAVQFQKLGCGAAVLGEEDRLFQGIAHPPLLAGPGAVFPTGRQLSANEIRELTLEAHRAFLTPREQGLLLGWIGRRVGLGAQQTAYEKHERRVPHACPLYNLILTSFLDQAGCWFLNSGIQEPGGGVARYFRSDTGKNAPVSNEITGYAVSALVYLHSLTGKAPYLEAASRAAGYLCRHAWDQAASTFPFEPGSDRAYFFDTGIIVRGLAAAWRATGDDETIERAREAALSLAFDFLGNDAAGKSLFHPIISLPEKQPLEHDSRWSRSPGCYQLKSALAWREVPDEGGAKLYESVLAFSLATHEAFLTAEPDREKLMDRLHAYCYFLEGLLPVAERAEVRAALAWGLVRAAALHREIAPVFERSDVAAQLLRVRLIAHHLGAVALDDEAAGEEASRAAAFQAAGDHPNLRLRGGFGFGAKNGALLPFSNPVSTAFCLQALELWRQHQEDRWSFDLRQLI
jgi:hypothetical protein